MPSPDHTNRPGRPSSHPSSRPAAREVTLTGLRRDTAAVVARVERGEVAVLTRHGRAVAVLVPVVDRIGLLPMAVGEADLAALAKQFAEREDRRRWSELLHGRWYNGHGIHGEYPSKRRRV